MYVTGVNCNSETALEEMTFIQKKFDKRTGNIAYHAYQSFKTGEVSPQLAHQIGVELAKEMWSEYQVVVATHFNTGTYHNHFIINSVNMFTGKKFNCNKGAYYKFRELSDKICYRNNLSVIEKPKGITPRSIYFAEKRGEPTKYNLMRKAIDEALEMSISYKQFKNVMRVKGYIINDDYSRKYPTIKSVNDTKATRMYHLGEKYQLSYIAEKVQDNPYYFQNRYYDFMNKQKPRTTKARFKGNIKYTKKIEGLDALFMIFFHFLGIDNLEKKHKPLSPEMKREVRKMERYAKEVRLICKYDFKTSDEVMYFIEKTEKNIDEVTNIRQKYRNKLRRCKNEDEIKQYKDKISKCTELLGKYRDEIKSAYNVLDDTAEVKRNVSIEKRMILENDSINRQKNKKRNAYER